MNKIIQELLSLADQLDSAGIKSAADDVDQLIKNAATVSPLQYIQSFNELREQADARLKALKDYLTKTGYNTPAYQQFLNAYDTHISVPSAVDGSIQALESELEQKSIAGAPYAQK